MLLASFQVTFQVSWLLNGLMAFENCVFESRKHKNFPAFPALTCLSLPPTQALGNNFA